MKIDVLEVSIFIFFFVLITVIGFVAARWRRADLNTIHEWGLAGRRFGTLVTWFLLGGDLYTAYTFIAVPGAVFTSGAIGFFAVPYTVLVYPIIFILMPKFWTVCKQRGYITAADFVKDRFGSSSLALAVAFTGILATLPYIALQMFGIQVSIAALGIPLDFKVAGVTIDIPLLIERAARARSDCTCQRCHGAEPGRDSGHLHSNQVGWFLAYLCRGNCPPASGSP